MKIDQTSIELKACKRVGSLPKRVPKLKNFATAPQPNVSEIIMRHEMIPPFKEG